MRTVPNIVTFPNSPYVLHQPFSPAGDQPTAIDKLCEGLEEGLMAQTLLGVTGSGKTYTMANVIAREGVPALIMAPNKTLAAQTYSEMREFFPNNAVEYFVSYYDFYQPEAYVPARDLFIEKDAAVNEHIEQMRLAATKSILERRDTIIVATVSAIYGIGKPESYTEMRCILRKGDRKTQRDLIGQLVRMQYKRTDMEFVRGTFRVRGDTIDVFPAEHAESAVRIELFDDEVDAILLFDPLTGLVQPNIMRFVIYPASHYVTPREEIVRAMGTIKAELKERTEELISEGRFVSATPAQYELEKSHNDVVEQVVRPTGLVDPQVEVRPAQTQVDDLLSEINEVVGRGERVIVTTLTKRMAEDLTDFLSEHGVKVRYLHSDIDTVERVEIIRDLRQGLFDVLVGINLLREGLDIPEASLVAILDADKEGFLRSERSLIQTIGRAARNLNGHAILYADRITDSMRHAIDETERRRQKQEAFNKEHGITPKGVKKEIRDIIDGVYRGEDVKVMPESKLIDVTKDPSILEEKNLSKRLKQLEAQMMEHAKNLDFEKAVKLREELTALRAQAFGASPNQ